MKIFTDTIEENLQKIHTDIINIYYDLPKEVGEALHYDMTYAIEDIKEAIETLKISIDRANGIWED